MVLCWKVSLSLCNNCDNASLPYFYDRSIRVAAGKHRQVTAQAWWMVTTPKCSKMRPAWACASDPATKSKSPCTLLVENFSRGMGWSTISWCADAALAISGSVVVVTTHQPMVVAWVCDGACVPRLAPQSIVESSDQVSMCIMVWRPFHEICTNIKAPDI